MTDQELIRLTAAAQAGGSRRDAIAAACGVRDYTDITVSSAWPCGKAPTPERSCCSAPPRTPFTSWPGAAAGFLRCAGIAQLRAAGHRPRCDRLVHVEHGQATEDEQRCKRLARLIVHLPDPAGPAQRH